MAGRSNYGSSAWVGDGARIARVDAESPAALAGLHEGDIVREVDDSPVPDIIEWQWLTDGGAITLAIERAVDDLAPSSATMGGSTTVHLARNAPVPWGIHFAAELFDAVRTCENRCEFCFMAQLPPGMRPALYLRDDDFRLSFLHGNFITLTNLTDADVDRIAEERLSPLYVSLHAVDLEVRAKLVGARNDGTLTRFDEVLDAGVDQPVQVVLVPGVNDAEVLEQTLAWLAEREGVASVGIVPLGYTRHQSRYAESYESAPAAAAVIDHIERWQAAFRERDGISWVYAADEFYLNAGRELPAWETYDEFPQYENGIGLARAFLDEFAEAYAAAQGLRDDIAGIRILTGTLAAPLLRDAVASLGAAAADVAVIPVTNDFFGGNVSVAGLLAAADIVAAIRADRAATDSDSATDGEPAAGPTYVLPDVVFNADGLTLDDATLDELVRDSESHIRVVSCDAAGLAGILLGSPKPEHETR